MSNRLDGVALVVQYERETGVLWVGNKSIEVTVRFAAIRCARCPARYARKLILSEQEDVFLIHNACICSCKGDSAVGSTKCETGETCTQEISKHTCQIYILRVVREYF